MGACLGICLGDKLVKYARLEQDDKTKNISLNSYGTKYVTGDAKEVIPQIISETASTGVPLCLSLPNAYNMTTEVLKQLGKNDVNSVIGLEVGDYATSKGINEKTLEYRYMLANSRQSTDSYTAQIYVGEKSDIAEYTEDETLKGVVAGMYPIEYVLTGLIKNYSNYLLLNVEDKTSLIYVCGDKVTKINEIDVGMKNILDAIAEREGSYSKAYDICKGINVYTDDEGLSQDLEKIIEPVIQDLLNRVRNNLTESNIKVEKIYLNGLVNLFINIDVLFEQFFSITTEKVRPHFLEVEEAKYNMAEVIEVNEATALAYEGLTKSKNELNFVAKQSSKFSLKGIKLGGTSGGKKTFVMPNINKEKIENAMMFATLTAGTVFTGYVAFSSIYNAEMVRLAKKVTEKTNALKLETATINTDISYIKNNTDKYTTYNNYISQTVEKIREGKIGKYTTYNVANFMQKVAKYIPTNVQLETISSNDNKTVTIVAKSTSYAELGYFISQLKLQGILENVKTGKVEHGTSITVTIGGDLP